MARRVGVGVIERVDAYASHAHYAEHIRPVWDALPAERRGTFFAPRGTTWGERVGQAKPRALIIAGAVDAYRWPRVPLVMVEHGAGQTYHGDPRLADSPSYSGGKDLDQVGLFLCPNRVVGENWLARYPSARVAVVGCPKLDAVRAIARTGRGRVAMTFHWSCPTIPETMPALPHYLPVLRPLAQALGAAGGSLVGHAHPRGVRRAAGTWAAVGVPFEPDGLTVLRQADVLVADNTSLMYEAAALGIPVVALNAPWYRRDVEHGLRFWSHVPGRQVDEPDDLIDAVLEAVEDPTAHCALRSAAVTRAYEYHDDRAAGRAARQILDWLDDA
jgi:hypothetical protein